MANKNEVVGGGLPFYENLGKWLQRIIPLVVIVLVLLLIYISWPSPEDKKQNATGNGNASNGTVVEDNWRTVDDYWKAQWLDNWYHAELPLKVDWSEPFYLPVNQTCRVVTEKGAKAQVRINGEDKNLAMFDEVGNFLNLDGTDHEDYKYIKRYEVRGTNTNVGKAYRIYCYPIRK
jgi:hypothetical protein